MKGKESFAVLVTRFYSEYLLGSTDSVKILAEIHKRYEKEHELMKKAHKDNDYDLPYIINKFDDLSEKAKNNLLLIIYKGSYLSKRLNKLFELTSVEKLELADDMIEFKEYAEEKIKELDYYGNCKDK